MSIQQDIAELSAREIPQFDPTGLQQQPGFDCITNNLDLTRADNTN